MNKLLHKFTAAAVSAAMLLTMTGCGRGGNSSDSSSDGSSQQSSQQQSGTANGEAESMNITVWCAENLVELTKKQLGDYNTENNTNFTFTIESVGEGDAAKNMITDVTAGADIYSFAQDQLARLVQSGALTQISSSLAETITAENDETSVAAASMNGKMYAFPLTSDNGYFMYYDKSVITDEAMLRDQTALIEACKAAGRTIAFELTGSMWYGASYFFGAGGTSDWTIDESGAFTDYNDTFNSEHGIIATRGMAELINSGVFVNSSSAASFSNGAAVVVTGVWDYTTAAEALGDNLGCAELWNYTVDGESYHLTSFSGNKLIGVKPQNDAKKAAYCQSIAQYLTSEKCQQERFDTLAWGPSNKNVQASESVQQNVALAALSAQNRYAKPQGQYPNGWWDLGMAVAGAVQSLGTPTPTDEQLQAILDTYSEGLKGIK